ncbi:MAG: hypothetical protein FWG16_01435 [Micrococcales bacterium]|nr:hypothetical protein [Micrococcales bacterium]
MELSDVVNVVGGLEQAGITVWIDGGWCVDALVGRELREHSDLDLAVRHREESALVEWLTARGYVVRQDPTDTACNYVFLDVASRAIDVHVFEFDQCGNHTYGIEYPRESLTGRATLGGLEVHCVAPQWMFRFKTGYKPAPKDLIDVQALADRYGYQIPPTHQFDSA